MTTISTPHDLREEATALVFECAPRRFALCWIGYEEDDGGILAWGLQFGTDHAVTCGESGGGLGRFASAEDARRLYARAREVLLVWIDEDAPSPRQDAP